MNSGPTITGILIFLNGEKYLAEAIDSVLAQTYTDWELLLCDDGSTDGATAIAKDYAARYPDRIRYFEHPNHENRGMSATRNLGIANSRGQYIAMLDADDVWVPEKLVEQLAVLEAHPEAAMVYGPMRMWYSWTGRPEDKRRDWLQPLGVPANSIAQPPDLLLSFLRDPSCHVCGLLTRKDVLAAVGGYENEFRTEYEDVVVQSKISVQYPVYASGKCWYWYRQHDDSCTSATRRNWQQRPARLKYLNKFEGYLESKQLTSGPVWDEVQKQLRPFRSLMKNKLDSIVRSAAGSVWSVTKTLLPSSTLARIRAAKWKQPYVPQAVRDKFERLATLSHNTDIKTGAHSLSADDVEHSMRILQLSSWQREGGAERVAMNLHCEFRHAGHDATLAVGGYSGAEPDRPMGRGVIRVPNHEGRSAWTRQWWAARDRLRVGTTSGRVSPRRAAASVANMLAEPMRAVDRGLGREEFRFPGTRALPLLRPDIIHCHNLHGSYFDLRLLPWLSRQSPVVLTLHDHWLLGGHCSYPFECDRWTSGCGNCPHLDIYPQLQRDGTASNWKRKAEIFAASRVYVAAPCRWLLDRVKRSMLSPAVVESRVIPYGIDLKVFHADVDRRQIRQQLDLNANDRVLLYVANRLRTNVFKDFQLLRDALPMIANSHTASGTGKLIFIALGDQGASERIGQAELRFVPFEEDPHSVARYYQAADVFVHAARADNFPNTVLESLACGTPVVATSVGGIPEQISDLNDARATGALTPPGDATALAQRVITLLADDDLRRRLSHNAAIEAARRFDLKTQREAYLSWFAQILAMPSRSSADQSRTGAGQEVAHALS